MSPMETGEAAPAGRRSDRRLLVLRALAAAPGAMSTAEVADACFREPHPANSTIHKAWRVLRRLAESGKAEVSGEVSQHGNGGPMLTWKITAAGRAWLAGRVRGLET
jgi:hypothetical protein